MRGLPSSEILHFHHLGIAVAALPPAIPVYEDLFGYRLLRGPFEDPIQRVAVCFLAQSTQDPFCVELVAPLGDDSPIAGVLKKGGGAYHTCYECADLDAALARMKSKRCLVISEPVPAVAFGGRRIAWLYTPTRQLVELLEAE
jgi:methylmalonyl-CoA/ethylmalonyl-CoA epimerase